MKLENETREAIRKQAQKLTIKRLALLTCSALVLFLIAYFISFLIVETSAVYTEEGITTYSSRLFFDFWDLVVTFFFLWLVGVVLVVWVSWIRVQNISDELTLKIEKENLQRAIQSRYRSRFWVSFGLYSAIMVLLIMAVFILKDSRIWYDYDPWYSLLATLRDLFPFAVITLWAGGAAVLLFRQWNRSASDIVGLVDSIDQMNTGTQGDTIEVPQNLIELKPVLQEMFDTSCENRQAVLETEKKKNDLVLYLAHDLKTPLTSVVGYLSLLSESEDLAQDEKDRYIEIAKDKAIRLEGLIDQFFEISKFSFQEMELNKTSFSVNVLLLQLSEEFYPALIDHEKQIKVLCEDNLEIVGDANLIARALNNVIRNAIAYSAPKSTIEIQAVRAESAIQFSIVNEGKDIPQNQLDSIFEKFYRLNEARPSESGGAGLGLAIAQEIIIRHKGSIQATSAGGKTTFTITIPHESF